MKKDVARNQPRTPMADVRQTIGRLWGWPKNKNTGCQKVFNYFGTQAQRPPVYSFILSSHNCFFDSRRLFRRQVRSVVGVYTIRATRLRHMRKFSTYRAVYPLISATFNIFTPNSVASPRHSPLVMGEGGGRVYTRPTTRLTVTLLFTKSARFVSFAYSAKYARYILLQRTECKSLGYSHDTQRLNVFVQHC